MNRQTSIVIFLLVFTCVPLAAQNLLSIPDTLSGSELQLILREGRVRLRHGSAELLPGAGASSCLRFAERRRMPIFRYDRNP